MTRSPEPSLPSAAELSELEHAFATDPSGRAYRPLAEAYLRLGRFMEAMVVCRKGMRALPESPEPHYLLARIQHAQGRAQRAIEELKTALEKDADHVPSLALLAQLHFEEENDAEGAKILGRAVALAPDDEDVVRLAKAHGVEPAAPARAEPEAVSAAQVAPQPAPAATRPEPRPAPEPEPAPTTEPAPTPVKAAEAVAASAKTSPRASAPASAPVARPAAVALDPAAWDEEEEERQQAGGRRAKVRRFGITVAVLLVALTGWFGYSRSQANREKEIRRLLQQTSELVRKDGHGHYREAMETARRIVELDGKNAEAHAYLAYVAALRWGEQGDGEDFHRQAKEHLEQAEKRAPDHARVLAAKALLTFFEGDPAGAEKILTEALKDRRGPGIGLLYETLGRIRMASGDLDGAVHALKEAQGYDFNNVRLLSALGTVHWRRGSAPEAWAVLDSALRIDDAHVDSLVGKVLVVLDSLAQQEEQDRKRLLEEAKKQIEKVLSLPQGSVSTRQLARARFAQAQLALVEGDDARGRRLEQEAFALDPNNADLRVLRGRRLLREGKASDAAREFEQALEKEQRLSTYVDLYAALIEEPQRLVSAMEGATRVFARAPRAWLLLGDARRKAGDAAGARAAYERALELGDGMPEARVRIAALHRDAREYDKAKAEVEKALAAMSRRSGAAAAAAYTELGRIQEEGDRDLAAAFDSYAKALGAWENHAPAYFHIGRLSARHGSASQRRQAIESLETYLRLDANGEMAAEARRLLATLR